jgi:colicin import membrane protein
MKSDLIQDEYSEDIFIGFIKSIALHLFLVILAMLIGLIVKIFPTSFLSSEKVTIVTSAVKVDVVGMPKMSLQELKNMELPQLGQAAAIELEKTQMAQASAESSKIEFEQTDKKKSVSDLLKSFSQKKLPTNKQAPQKAGTLSGVDRGALNRLILEGNKLSQGSSLTGDIGTTAADGVLQTYALALPNAIRPYWKLPSFLLEQNLNCRVRVFIGANGELLKAEIYTSSGDAEYDQKALEATRRAAPFTKPSDEITGRMARGEIILGFPL